MELEPLFVHIINKNMDPKYIFLFVHKEFIKQISFDIDTMTHWIPFSIGHVVHDIFLLFLLYNFLEKELSNDLDIDLI